MSITDVKRCGAKLRNKDATCKGAAMTNGRCRIHGGTSLAGPAAPSYRHGRTSKYLPTRLHGRYAEAVNDPALLSLRSDIAIIATRLGEVLEKLETGESREAWGLLASEWADLRSGYVKMADADRERAFDRVDTLVKQGLSETYVWAEARQLIRERAGLVESERRRLVEMQQYITKEQAFVLVTAVVDVIRRYERNPQTLSSISRDISALTSGGIGDEASA